MNTVEKYIVDYGYNKSKQLKDFALKIWNDLIYNFPDNTLQIPDVIFGEDERVLFEWRIDHLYFECEIFEDGKIEYFFRDRFNCDLWGDDTTIDEPFSQQVLEKFKLFVKCKNG